MNSLEYLFLKYQCNMKNYIFSLIEIAFKSVLDAIYPNKCIFGETCFIILV